jgi:hypothetical protein
MATMLSSPTYVHENYRLDDLLNIEVYVNKLRDKVNASEQVSLIGIIGAFGTGKSLMLEKYKRKLEKDKYVWIHFDAWKYPDRHNLWEGFVLDFARQIDNRTYKAVLDKIDGRQGEAKKILIKSVGALSNLKFPGSGAAIDKLAYFARSTPAKRVSEIQDVFESLIKETSKDIYIVAEDVDRSGAAGVYFIETLNQLLHTSDTGNKITAFIPISDTSFEANADAYIKALDHIAFFDIGSRGMSDFVKKVFAKEIVNDPIAVDHLTEWLQRIMIHHKITIRTVKLIIRNSELLFKSLHKSNHKPDARIVLAIESCRFFSVDIGGIKRTPHSYMRDYKETPERMDIEHLLRSIELNKTWGDASQALEKAESEYIRRIKFIDRDEVNERTSTTTPFLNEHFLSLPLYYLDLA